MKELEVYARVVTDGVEITFQQTPYVIKYPQGVWASVPNETKIALKDNLSLATTMHLPLVFDADQVRYHSGRPLLESYFFMNFLKDLPSCTEVDGTSTGEVMRRFFNLEYQFLDPTVVHPSPDPVESPHRAVVALSFGKDSLLTFAVAKEIGLDPEVVYIVEQSLTYEEKHKTALGKRFKQEFNRDLRILHHETGKLRDYQHLGVPKSELGWGLQNTEYTLEILPFAYKFQGKYIFFGNEQTTAASYRDATNRWVIYPAFDQSHLWTVHLDQIAQTFSGRSVHTGSLIEPLMDIMVQRILAHRYPELAKYQMSCFTENISGKDYRWCHDCSVCAKMYLLCVASGIDPQSVGLKQNMLDAQYKSFFTMFGGKSDLTYANTPIARDEQLFAFYAAARRGVSGGLIEDFQSSELYQEAKDREEELYATFIKLYDPISLPRELKDAVYSIYREELHAFEW